MAFNARSVASRPGGRGLLICLISRPGLGKSSLLAQIPGIEFICDRRDQGILDLMEYPDETGVRISRDKVEIVKTFDDLKSALIAKSKSSCPVVGLESLVGIQSLCEDDALRIDYENKGGSFQNFQNGPNTAANKYYQQLIDIMLDMQTQDQTVIMTGHAKLGTGKAISGEDWISQVLEASPAMVRRIEASFSAILHIGSTISVNKQNKVKIRATSMDTNVYVDVNPYFPAKNRMGLVDTFPWPPTAKEAYLELCKALRLNPATFKRM